MKKSTFRKMLFILCLTIAAGAFLSPWTSAHGAETIYEDAEDGNTLGWECETYQDGFRVLFGLVQAAFMALSS